VRKVDDRGLPLGRRGQNGGARPVAEEHAGGPILVIDDARHRVGADNERVIVRSGGDHLHSGRERVGEARAGGAQIVAPRGRRADLVLEQARGAGEDRIRRRRAHDDESDIARRQAGLRDGAERRLLRHVRRRHPVLDDVALADARALQDPLVAGLDELLQVRVRQHPRRHVRRQPRELHTPECYHSRSFRCALMSKNS
jgi:hypothetical protein